MKAKDIKSIKDAERYVEGCINDFESGISTKEETMKFLFDYTVQIIEMTKRSQQPKELNAKEFLENKFGKDRISMNFGMSALSNLMEEYSQLQTREDEKCSICKKDKYLTPTTPDKGLCVCVSHPPNNKVDTLIEKYEEYIELLSKDITNNAAYLLSHNIKSKQEDIKKGIQLRKEIQDLKQIKL